MSGLRGCMPGKHRLTNKRYFQSMLGIVQSFAIDTITIVLSPAWRRAK